MNKYNLFKIRLSILTALFFEEALVISEPEYTIEEAANERTSKQQKLCDKKQVTVKFNFK